MRRREFFRRWDAHMGRMDTFVERMDGYMARGEVLVADIRTEVELTRQEVELSRASRDDLRSFIREINARMERSTQAMIAELRDLREESRAHRQALLRLIDRMDGLEPGGASAG